MPDPAQPGLLLEAFDAGLRERRDMPAALQALARAAGADGAVLVRENPGSFIEATATPGMISLADYASSGRPIDPRQTRVNPRLDGGFRLDHDDFSAEELARDPFYQEFRRPRGYFWHASALLLADMPGGGLYFTLNRQFRRGAFESAGVAGLARLLPSLRLLADAAEAFAKAAMRRHDRPLAGGELALFVDREGHLTDFAPAEPIAGGLLTIVQGRLRASRAVARGLVARLIETAIERGAPAFAQLGTDHSARRWMLRIVPAPAGVRQPWHLQRFVALVSEIRRRVNPDPRVAAALSDLFALSPAEAKIAALLSHGWTIEQTAASLSLSEGTVRNHLKSVFSKTGISRQTELAVLVAQL
jgi:DNA-binding CsgD family transcriptional regulator